MHAAQPLVNLRLCCATAGFEPTVEAFAELCLYQFIVFCLQFSVGPANLHFKFLNFQKIESWFTLTSLAPTGRQQADWQLATFRTSQVLVKQKSQPYLG
jgi:hypothetical protein